MADHRGKVLIISFLAVGLCAAIFPIWYLRQYRSAAIEFWGKPVALNIRDAKRIELYVISGGEGGEPVDAERVGPLPVSARADITGSPGLLQLRSYLLDNGAFRFDEPTPDAPVWRYALQFDSPGTDALQTTLIFAPEEAVLWHLESDRKVDVTPQQQFIAYFLDDVAKKKIKQED